MAISRMEMEQVMNKLDSVEVQIMKLKAMLLQKAKPTKAEIKAMGAGKKEIARGEWISSKDLIKKLG